jgi:biotin carboxylase
MKTLAIIGASYLQRPLVVKAKSMGLRTICFAWAEGAVCKDIVDVFYPISIVEKEQISAICQQEHIDGICTIASDVAAPTVAYVAEQMGLVGNSYEASLKANNKYLMRQAFMDANVPCPQFDCVDVNNLHNNLRDIESTMSLPLIVKPSDRSGSLAVNKVESWKELKVAVELSQSVSFCHEAMVEEYIEGQEISVEFISYQGKHYPLQITDKVTTGAPHFVELEHHQPSSLSPDMYQQIYAITNRALDALGVTNGASHSEYKITDDGRIVIMEIGARMGGDFIGSDLVQLSTGYDFVRGVIEVALAEFNEPVFCDRYYSGVFFLSAETIPVAAYIKNSKRYPEIVQAEQTDTELHHVTCSAERSGYFIYQATKKFEL